MKRAYLKSFTASTIISAYKKLGCFPVDGTVFGFLLPRSYSETTNVIETKQLVQMFQKRWKNSTGDCFQPVVVHTELVSTMKSVLIASFEVSEVLQAQ